ncbi:ABC transporter permease [Nocardioides sp. YIM 152588]|uniref:ABC transporter permease n=1 Tax=Nocardioides sp. YIM 152588 TaxID=3158259 RepID=UPI0032E3CA69
MSATTYEPGTAAATDAVTGLLPARHARSVPAPIPTSRVLGVELRKMFDTRSGFWLMVSIVLLSITATAAVIIFSAREDLTYGTFAAAIGIPMSVVLPMVAILSVTSEWSQRTGLTTFTLVPSRGRVIGAKAALAVAIAAVSMVVALGVGAVGNLVGTAIAGVDPVWDISAREFGQIVLANELVMLVGFTLGVLLRNSAAGIIGYFVWSFVIPGISAALEGVQQWWLDNAAWFELNTATYPLFDGLHLTGQMWAQLAVTTTLWVALPLAVGVWTLLRSEVK